MTAKQITGVYAAVLTPRLADDRVDIEALGRLIRFLMAKGICSFAVNGATGEFCLTRPAQLQAMLATVKEASAGKGNILCGVGAAGSAEAMELARIAQAEDVTGLLLPMPFFFPYQQEDLELYCRTVASSTSLPTLLYNLPQFASGLRKETVRRLIVEIPNIVGIKDSSGSLGILRDLTEHGVEAYRIVGSDGVLAQALTEGVCDGVVSGVACALPEVICEMYANRHKSGSAQFRRASQLIDEFIARLELFPTPWGLKWAVEARRVIAATFSQPLTPHRHAQGKELAAWLETWLPSAVPNEPALRPSSS